MQNQQNEDFRKACTELLERKRAGVYISHYILGQVFEPIIQTPQATKKIWQILSQ
jgi:hypothetical protein